MPSSYTPRGGYEKQATGENTNTWGVRLNDNAIALIDEAVHGVEAIAVSGPVTLTSTNGVSNQARQGVHKLTGTGGTVTVPAVENKWLVINDCSGAVTYTAGGAGVALQAGERAFVACDGTDITRGPSSYLDFSTAFSATSTTANAIGTGAKTYTVQSGRAFAPGMGVRISDSAAPTTNYMEGTVTAYAGTSLTVSVASAVGAGTPAAVAIAFSQASITLPPAGRQCRKGAHDRWQHHGVGCCSPGAAGERRQGPGHGWRQPVVAGARGPRTHHRDDD